tara:strand:+ start:859 stop:1083 length:225 start_codon:yes stop_codon:yes gene_type:complete
LKILRKNKDNCCKKKLIIAHSILWAASMLSVSILYNKEFVLLILILLSSVSLFLFRTKYSGKELTDAVEEYEKK